MIGFRLAGFARLGAAALFVASAVVASCAAAPAASSSLQRLMRPEHIIHFVRVRWQIPETVQLTAERVRPSSFSEFYETKVAAHAGGRRSQENFFISKDGRCFISNPVFPLTGRSWLAVIHCIRQAIKLPPSAKITLGALQESVFPGLLKASVTVEDGGKKATGRIFITADRRTGILGAVLPFSPAFVKQLINTKNQPSVGPARARVTIVEYADLECPYCARFQQFLERDFLPKYGGEVRLIFKEFPLSKHPWSMSAAIGNECAYQIDPTAFARFRGLIFAHQDEINLTNVRDKLLDLGEQAGISRPALARCMDVRASRPRVEADLTEVQNLGLMFLPTLFVNGRIAVNPSPQGFERLVDRELAAPRREE
jgi:protein-disulfide isomerase